MEIALTLSGIFNILLAIVFIALGRHMRRYQACRDADFERFQEEKAQDAARFAGLMRQYYALSEAVAQTLGEIRRDIDRNYHHTHDGHLLDGLAYDLLQYGQRHGCVWLSDHRSDEVRKAGGDRFIAEGESMNLAQLLEFAWHFHACARKQAEGLYEIVQESCGRTDKSVWLGKTLTIFERICGNREDAIATLGRVMEDWKRAPLLPAIYHVRP